MSRSAAVVGDTEVPSAPAPPDGWRTTWSGAPGITAAVILLVQLVWRTSYLAQGYFTQDDFLMLHLGGTSTLGPHYLFQDYAGHLWPGAFLISFVEARLWPLSWPAAYLPIIGMQLAAGALMWVLLTRLLGARWQRVPLLAVFCFSPLTLWATQWWAVAITLLPLELCGIGAALCFLTSRRSDNPWWYRGVVVLVAAGLMFQERGMLIPVLVFAVALIMDRTDGVRARIVNVVRADRRLWLTLVLVDVVYLLLHVWLAPVQSGGGNSQYAGLISNFFFRNAIPGVFGGPWTGTVLPATAVIPPPAVVVGCVILLVALLVSTLRWDGTTTRLSWLVLVIYVGSDAALLLGGRTQFGSASGLLPRYAADLMPIVVVALAGAIRDVRLPEGLARYFAGGHRLDRVMVSCLVVSLVYLASAAITSHLMASDWFNTSDRTYVDNLHHDLQQQPAAVVYDGTVPNDVLISWFGNNDRVSVVYGLASDAPKFDVPSEQMRIVDANGHLQPMTLKTPVHALPGPVHDCGYAVTLTPVQVPMSAPVPQAKNVLRLGYYTDVNDVAVVTVDNRSQHFAVAPGLHSIDLVVPSGFDSFTMRLSHTPATLCLAAAAAGVPKPAAP